MIILSFGINLGKLELILRNYKYGIDFLLSKRMFEQID